MVPYQQTDSQTILRVPSDLSFVFPAETANETIGERPGACPFPSSLGSSLVEPARHAVCQARNEPVAAKAREVLSAAQEVITVLENASFELDHLAPLRAFCVEDGSLLIEWIFPDFRVGFSVESTLEDSGWYLVSNKHLGEISASGYISNVNLKSLILWLFSFVVFNT